MADLFGWAQQPPPARRAAPPPEPARPTPAPPEAPAAPPPARAEPAPPSTWPRTLPSAAQLADPAFAAVLDAVRPWMVALPGRPGQVFAGADEVVAILDALRRRGLLSGAPSAVAPAPEAEAGLPAELARLWPQDADRRHGAAAAAQLLRALPEYELWLGMRPGAIPRCLGTSHHLADALDRATEAAHG